MNRHVAFNALAVILRWLTSHQRGVILGQPIGHLALRSYHRGLQRAQVPPSGSSASCSAFLGARSVVVRRELWHMVFNGDFPRGSIVKLDGEGGMTLSCGADNAVLQCLSVAISQLLISWIQVKAIQTHDYCFKIHFYCNHTCPFYRRLHSHGLVCWLSALCQFWSYIWWDVYIHTQKPEYSYACKKELMCAGAYDVYFWQLKPLQFLKSWKMRPLWLIAG